MGCEDPFSYLETIWIFWIKSLINSIGQVVELKVSYSYLTRLKRWWAIMKNKKTFTKKLTFFSQAYLQTRKIIAFVIAMCNFISIFKHQRTWKSSYQIYEKYKKHFWVSTCIVHTYVTIFFTGRVIDRNWIWNCSFLRRLLI